MRIRGALLVAVAGAVALVVSGGRACRVRPEGLEVRGDAITVRNLGRTDWTGVDIRLNAYYRGGAPRLEAGGRLDAPLVRFLGSSGRYFDPSREPVRQVRVTARAADGTPVSLEWRAGERR